MKKKLKSIIASILATTVFISIADFSRGNAYAEEQKKYEEDVNYLEEVLKKTPEEYAIWKSELLSKENEKINNEIDLLSLDNYIGNEYIEVVTSNDGRFTIGTIEGDPSITTDNNRKLLYGHPNPGTSFTTIRVNEEDMIFSAESIKVENEKIISTMKINDEIEVDEILSLETNETTGRNDIVKISYEIRNLSNTSANVGVRIMLDTMLGFNDGAPFSVAGSPLVNEKEFTGSSIPQYWQAFDDLSYPGVVSNGTVYKNSYERPDKIQFCAWPMINGTVWEYDINESVSVTSDSAVAIYYNPTTVYPNGKKTVSTYYGVGTVGGTADGSESFRVISPEKLTVINNNYMPNPFTITSYVKNTSEDIMYNATATLNLPNTSALTLLSDNNVNIGNLNPGEQKTVAWKVTATPQQEDKSFDYNVVLSSTSHDIEKVSKNILLPSINGSSIDGNISLNTNKLELGIGGTATLIATVDNLPGNITWLSDNTAVAKVDSNGKITAKSTGKAKVTASISGKQAVCEVTVSGGASGNITSFTLNNLATIKVNEKIQLTPKFMPTNIVNKRVNWKSTNPSVATVEADGTVRGVKVGTAEIIATSEFGGKIARCKVTVNDGTLNLNLGSGIEFNKSVKGPSLTFLKKDFNLFEMDVEISLLDKFPFNLDNKVKLQYDSEKNMYIGVFGDFSEDFNTKEDLKDRQKAYQTIKSLMGMIGKKTNRVFYNKWRALTKKKGPLVIKGDSTAFGYVGFVIKDGKPVLVEGEVGVLGEMEAEYKQATPVPSVFFKFGLSGNAQTGIKPVLKEAGNLLSGVYWNSNFEVGIGLSAAVGFDAFVANTYGGVEGELEGKLDLPVNRDFIASRDFSVSADIKAFLEYEAFMVWGDKKSWKLKEWSIYPKQSRVSELMLADISEDDLTLIDRVNSINHIGSEVAVMSNFNEDEVLVENVFPNTTAEIYQVGDKKILVWIGDVSSRNTTNRTALYYSVFDGGWSVPTIIDDDGTGDFDFDGYVNDEELYITWQNASKVFDENVSLDEFTKNTEICVAKYEGKSNKFLDSEILTKDSALLHAKPSITGNKDKVTITWITNSANDINGLEGVNTINSSSYENNKWDSKEILKLEEGNVIGGLDTLSLGRNQFITYSINQGNESQGEIYLIAGNKSPERITDNNVSDNHPVLVNHNGELELYWLSENNISVYNLDSKNESVIVEDANAIRGFKVDVTNENGMIYWEDTRGLVTTISGSILEVATGNWSKAVTLVNGYNGRLVGSTGYIEKDGTMNFVYTTAPIIGEAGEVDDIFGQSDMCYTEITPSYKIGITEDGVIFNDEEVIAGKELVLKSQVYNRGQLSVDSIMLQLYDSNGNKIAEQLSNTILEIGEISEYELKYKLPNDLQKGIYTMYARPYINGEILNDGILDESGATITIGDANLEFVDLSLNGNGKNRSLRAELRNNGYATVQDNIIVKLYADNELIDSKDIGKLNGQSDTETYFDIDMSKFDFSEDKGDILLRVEVECNPNDTLNLLEESVLLENPYSNNAITISSLSVSGDKLIFNINNNLPESVEGVLLIQDSYTDLNSMNTYGMDIKLDSYYSDTMEVDLSVISDTNSPIRIMVTNYDDVVISNVTKFMLDADKILYPLEIKETEGGVVAIGEVGKYAAGTEILLSAIADDNYEFEGWVSENGGIFEDVTSAETKFIMPECGTVIMPIFKEKVDIEKTKVSFKVSDNEKKYNGKEQLANISVKVHGDEEISESDYAISYLKDGVQVSPKEDGTYDIVVTIINPKFELADDNNVIGSLVILRDEIKDNDYEIKGNKGDGDWFNSDVEIVAKRGYKISLDSESWSESILINTDGRNIVSYYIMKDDGSITKSKTLTINKDTVKPNATFEFNEDKSSKKGILTVTATDETSGIKKIEVLLNNKVISSLDDESNKFEINKSGKYEIRVTDNSGLVTISKFECKLSSVGSSGNNNNNQTGNNNSNSNGNSKLPSTGNAVSSELFILISFIMCIVGIVLVTKKNKGTVSK